MKRRWLECDACPVVADDIAGARSTLLTLRAKIDTKDNAKIHAYGQALLYVAQLISAASNVNEANALNACGMNPDEMDRIYRDLCSSVRRCRTFLQEGPPAFEMADNFVTACTILMNLYRMRFHEQKASGTQQVESRDLAERIMTLSQALYEFRTEVLTSEQEGEKRLVA